MPATTTATFAPTAQPATPAPPAPPAAPAPPAPSAKARGLRAALEALLRQQQREEARVATQRQVVHSLSAKVLQLREGVDGLRREQDALKGHLTARRERRSAATPAQASAVDQLDARARRLEAAWQSDRPRMQAMLGRSDAALSPAAVAFAAVPA